MRGNDEPQGAVFSYVSAEQRIAADHPLRQIRTMTDAALRELSPEFDALYAPVGRRSVAPVGRRGRCCCRSCIRGGANGW